MVIKQEKNIRIKRNKLFKAIKNIIAKAKVKFRITKAELKKAFNIKIALIKKYKNENIAKAKRLEKL